MAEAPVKGQFDPAPLHDWHLFFGSSPPHSNLDSTGLNQLWKELISTYLLFGYWQMMETYVKFRKYC